MPRLASLPLITGAAAFLAGMLASLLLGWMDVERHASAERSRVVARLALTRAQIEGAINSTFNSTDGLVHLISIEGRISADLFAEMARLAIGKNPHIRNITIAPVDVIGDVFPRAGNERVIGARYADHPEQARTVRLARERGQAILAGPVQLIQGGRALIHRNPVFTTRDEPALRYWGTVSIVARLDTVFEPLRASLADGIEVAVRGRDGLGADGEMVEGNPALFEREPVLMEVEIPGGQWQLAAIPSGGWRDPSLLASQYLRFGLVVSLLIGIIVAMRSANIRQARSRNAELELEVRERQRAEAALRDEQLRFRSLFERSPDPAWILEDDRFVECNEAANRLFGATCGAHATYRDPAAISPPLQPDGESSRDKAERMITLARLNGVHRFEWTHRRADGSSFPAEVTLSAFSLHGKPLLHCVIRDISVRKAAENELRASRNLMQAILESAGAVIYVFDTDGRLLLCNQQFEAVIGQARERLLGQPRTDFLDPDVAGEHIANDRAVIAAGERMAFEEHAVIDGTTHYYLTVKCPIFDDDGAIRGIVGVSTDITDRRQHEEQLKLAAAVLASTVEGVIITDVRSTIVSVNRAFTEITGYTAEEAIGRKPSLLRSERHGPAFYDAMWATLAATDTWQGEVWNRRKNGELYPEWLAVSAIRNDAGAVTHYVGVFSDISAIKLSQEKLEHLAHFDGLTDLPNRVLFQDRLAHAIDRAGRYRHMIAVLLMDLDGFKTVNDSLGHPAGDRLLRQVASRLQGCIRVEDTVARLGGDEFAVVLANLNDGGDAIEVVRKMLTAIEQPFDLDGMGALVTASVGIAVYPTDGATATELVRNADTAMYGAKEAGRNTYRFYQAEMTHRAQERLLHEGALRRAIEQREFEVWFQPQVSLHDGRLTGAEALVRWRDPQRGLVPPVEFIPLAERTGLILPVGEQVLDMVCARARQWREAGLPYGRLAVNVAVPQIERGDYVGLLRRMLDTYALPPDCLEIEITESLIMESSASVREVLQSVQALGITTAVDDFGTGYSSLAYLKDLPIDNLKIDRAFIRDLPENNHDAVITRAIIALAHSLGFKVIAEGIESDEQLDFLRVEGCDEAQGYRIGRPLPADEFEAWLRARA